MNLDSTIAALLAQQAEALIEPVVIRNAPKAVKAPKAEPIHKAEKAQVVKPTTNPAVFGISLPTKGSLTAQQFLLDGNGETPGLRTVGKRSFTTTNTKGEEITLVKRVESEIRPDTIRAIAAFIGFDTTADFAPQDTAARQEAARQMGYARTNGVTYREERASNRLLPGVTFGACDQHAKRVADLHAQETAIVAAIIEADKAGDEGAAGLERGRLASVQADLAYIGEGGRFAHPHTGR